MKSQLGKCEMVLQNVELERSINSFSQHPARFWSSRHGKKSQLSFFGLDIENPLGRGALTKIKSSP
jgi:hypothetical protein